MKYGVNTFIWASDFTESEFPLLEKIREHGFDGVELPMFRPSSFPAAKIRPVLETNGLECTICSVLVDGLSAISDDAAVRRRTLAHLQDCVKTAADVGARVIAGPLYSPVGYLPGTRRTRDEWQRMVECYQNLGDTLRAHQVQIAIEPLNRFETYFLNTAADAAALCRDIGHPSIGVLFDTFHANIEEKDPAAACLALGSCLKHFHASENDRGTPGTGHVDWPAIFQTLRTMRYDGWITIESFGFSLGEISAAASIWRDLAPRAEDIAFEGVKFLKQSCATHA
jgi:D-psicose/D-tagatose/L-ribulose 3-epimerase